MSVKYQSVRWRDCLDNKSDTNDRTHQHDVNDPTLFILLARLSALYKPTCPTYLFQYFVHPSNLRFFEAIYWSLTKYPAIHVHGLTLLFNGGLAFRTVSISHQYLHLLYMNDFWKEMV